MSLGFVGHKNSHFTNVNKPFFIAIVMIGKPSAVQSSHHRVTADRPHLLQHHRWHCCTAAPLTDSAPTCQSESTDCGVTPHLCIRRKALNGPILGESGIPCSFLTLLFFFFFNVRHHIHTDLFRYQGICEVLMWCNYTTRLTSLREENVNFPAKRLLLVCYELHTEIWGAVHLDKPIFCSVIPSVQVKHSCMHTFMQHVLIVNSAPFPEM